VPFGSADEKWGAQSRVKRPRQNRSHDIEELTMAVDVEPELERGIYVTPVWIRHE
jgi:hypothetical protein